LKGFDAAPLALGENGVHRLSTINKVQKSKMPSTPRRLRFCGIGVCLQDCPVP
jgi:hypothetical protein